MTHVPVGGMLPGFRLSVRLTLIRFHGQVLGLGVPIWARSD